MEESVFSELVREFGLEDKVKYVSNALSNKARRYLLCFTYFKGPLSLNEISYYFRNKKQRIDYHLRILEGSGLIKKEENNYSITSIGEGFIEVLSQ